MGILRRAEKRRARAREGGDRINSLHDDVLGNIVSLLPTKDGARTQILSWWRHLWRSAPLNLNLHDDDPVGPTVRVNKVSTHLGPCRRFVVPSRYDSYNYPTTTILDGWFRSTALQNLQELLFYHYPRLPLPPSVRRFSSTLRVGSFGGCIFPDGNNGGAPLLWPVLVSLTLSGISISQSSMHLLLASCPVLQSLALIGTNYVSSPLQIVSPSLRSIRVSSYWRRFEPVIEDAPCLERIQCSKHVHNMSISVISTPRLVILGELCDNTLRLQFGSTVLQGMTVAIMAAAVHSVEVLSLSGVKLCLDAAINLLKCFPHLEKLHIKATSASVQNDWYQTNPECISPLNIHVKKIVLENYQGSKSYVDFVNFFLSNARALESVELGVRNITTNKWIARQHSLLSIHIALQGIHRSLLFPIRKT